MDVGVSVISYGDNCLPGACENPENLGGLGVWGLRAPNGGDDIYQTWRSVYLFKFWISFYRSRFDAV